MIRLIVEYYLVFFHWMVLLFFSCCSLSYTLESGKCPCGDQTNAFETGAEVVCKTIGYYCWGDGGVDGIGSGYIHSRIVANSRSDFFVVWPACKLSMVVEGDVIHSVIIPIVAWQRSESIVVSINFTTWGDVKRMLSFSLRKTGFDATIVFERQINSLCLSIMWCPIRPICSFLCAITLVPVGTMGVFYSQSTQKDKTKLIISDLVEGLTINPEFIYLEWEGNCIQKQENMDQAKP